MRWKDSKPTYVSWGCRLPRTVSPGYVTDLLGLPPSHMRRVGETTAYHLDPEARQTVLDRPCPYSVWHYSSLAISQSPDLSEHVDIMTNIFAERKDKLDGLHALGAESCFRLWADNTTSFSLDLARLPRLLAMSNEGYLAMCIFSPDDNPPAGPEEFFRYRYDLLDGSGESASADMFFESTGSGAATGAEEEAGMVEDRFMASFVADVAALRERIAPRLAEGCRGTFSFAWQRDYMSFALSGEMVGQMASVADRAAFSLFA